MGGNDAASQQSTAVGSIHRLLEELAADAGEGGEDAGSGAEDAFDDDDEEKGQKAKPPKEVDPSFLETDVAFGLTSQDAADRKKKFGGNQLAETKENLVLKFLMFFVGPIQFVMIAAAALAGGLQEWIDLGVILGLLVLNAIVGFVQEFQAGNIVAQLKSKLALKASVLRDGRLQDIESVDVVPGDIVKLDEGTIVPADGKVVGDSAFLQVDQSSLTGESLAVGKKLGDLVYSSSAVKRGEALLLVTATGDSTFVGRTASLTQNTHTRGKFTEVLSTIGTILLVLVIFWVVVIWIGGFFRGLPIVELLHYALIITVVGVPVGLPAVVTTTLAVGAAYLAKKQAIVQRLSAIESLAGVEVLCSDKTGTLTKNKLVLHSPFLMDGVSADELVLTSALAASRAKKGLDAIDRAVIMALAKYPGALSRVDDYDVVSFQPFDPVTKRVVSEVRSRRDGSTLTCVKGAPLAVLRLIEEDHALPAALVATYNKQVAEFASRGFRSLGVARRAGGVGAQWEILGIMCLFDPPRDDTARTVQEAKNLGMSVKMLTGDAVGIARETARQLNLGTNIYDTKLLVGSALPGSELNDFVVAADGFAEVFPEHKYMVVDILQKRGHLVAMTGDGVNDAPSLKRADTGIAVEGASDAARTAADIVFLAPGLGTIIHAVKTARQIFHRMLAYVVYRIALSLHLEVFLTTSLLILNETINVNLIVFIAIFADIATLAIAYDKAPYSRSPVKWDLPKIWGLSIVMGVLLAIGTWIIYGTLLAPAEGIVQNHGNTQGILFLQVTLTENWLIFITRCNKSLVESLPSWQLGGAVLVVDIIASLFAGYGWLVGDVPDGQAAGTDIVTIVRVWIYSIGLTVVLSLVYFSLANSPFFERLVNGRLSEKPKKNLEDFLLDLERVSVMHEAAPYRRTAARRVQFSSADADGFGSEGLSAPVGLRRHERQLSADPDIA
ncbi:plasma membrane H+-ATPase [Cladochytrium tenue]|nr:plasma membrane H+-ATPase [Cladochytrium tenue]